MRLFDLFKRSEKSGKPKTDNGITGPTFLEHFTEHIQNPQKLLKNEWRRQLRTPSGQTQFRIKFYGRLHHTYPELITATDFAPALVYAIDESSGQGILLFDGCRHGYNALFADTFTPEQITTRPATNIYKDQNGNEFFAITISACYNIDYNDELANEVDETGFIQLPDGSKIESEEAIRNGFSTLSIQATSDRGQSINIISEELA
ncbi:MAG: hypothetical protein QM731_05310 [Chitinophagaceae bacterium]